MGVSERDNSIDIMRSIGLILIMLAHASPSINAIVQLRCFDVPMMIFVSGLTCANKKFDNYWEFIKKRTCRLIVPVYIFLVFYLLFIGIVQSLHLIPEYLTWRKVAESFLLLNGIGYVWIIRVFLLVMLVTPLLCKVKGVKNVVLIVLLLLACSEFIATIVLNMSSINLLYLLIKEYIIYILSYSAVFVLGLNFRYAVDGDKKSLFSFVSILFVLAAIVYFMFEGFPVSIASEFKYPPRTYFVVYGMFCSVILWVTRKWWSKMLDCKFMRFMGQNTIWIYLWHIPFVLPCLKLFDNWCLRFIVIFVASLAIFTIQYRIVMRLNNNNLKKYLVG